MAHRSRRAIAERRVLRIERAVAAAGYERGNQNERGKPTSKLILHGKILLWEKEYLTFHFHRQEAGGLHQAAIRACRSAVWRWPRHSRMIEGASLSTALEPPFVRYSMPEPCDDYAGAVPIGTHLSIAAARAGGRRRLTPPQSPLSDRRSPLVFLRCRDRTFPGTMPPNCQADPGAPPKARPAPCSLDSGQTCDAAYFASYSSPFSLPLRPHSSGRQRRRQSSGHKS